MSTSASSTTRSSCAPSARPPAAPCVAYSSGWKAANGCSGRASHYETPYDGTKSFYCVSEGSCTGGDVIRCSWTGGHHWLFDNAEANGGLVTFFPPQAS